MSSPLTPDQIEEYRVELERILRGGAEGGEVAEDLMLSLGARVLAPGVMLIGDPETGDALMLVDTNVSDLKATLEGYDRLIPGFEVQFQHSLSEMARTFEEPVPLQINSGVRVGHDPFPNDCRFRNRGRGRGRRGRRRGKR